MALEDSLVEDGKLFCVDGQFPFVYIEKSIQLAGRLSACPYFLLRLAERVTVSVSIGVWRSVDHRHVLSRMRLISVEVSFLISVKV